MLNQIYRPDPLPESLTPQMRARIAFMRFGLGPRPGGPARIGMKPSSAMDACLREVNDPGAALLTDPTLPTYDDMCRKALEDVQFSFATNAAEMTLRYAKHMEPEVGFAERLVLFWTNHFSISYSKGLSIRATAGHYEREVIRRNVLGNFSDMLKAAIQHPAMLWYLDNVYSCGPNTPVGRRYKRSYNENLAREILELHTLGVGGGYSQEDVTDFAKILTGWTVQTDKARNKAGQFHFEPDAHEPGSFKVMGQTFGQSGLQQGLAVLDMLAGHTATAQHLCYKLIKHFVTDEPSPNMVNKLAKIFMLTKGNLRAVSAALVSMAEAWLAPMSRIRQPYPWFVSMGRGLGFKGPKNLSTLNYWRYLSVLKQNAWECITPDGYQDDNYLWETPDAMRLRQDISMHFMQDTLGTALDPWPTLPATQLAQDLLPGIYSADALQIIGRWPDRRQAMSMLFMTPEYLRR